MMRWASGVALCGDIVVFFQVGLPGSISGCASLTFTDLSRNLAYASSSLNRTALFSLNLTSQSHVWA